MDSTPSDQKTEFEEDLQSAWYGIGGHMANNAWAALRILERASEQQQGSLLRYLCENYETWDTSGKQLPPQEQRFTDQQVQEELSMTHGRVLDALLESEFQANPSETSFYDHLWAHIHNPFFDSERLRAFALFWALIDDRTPYFHFPPGLRMSDQHWTQRRRDLYLEHARLRFLLRTDYEQLTEEADLILSVLEGAAQRADRVILVADLIAMAEQRGAQVERLAKGVNVG